MASDRRPAGAAAEGGPRPNHNATLSRGCDICARRRSAATTSSTALATARGRAADVAARQLLDLRGDNPGVPRRGEPHRGAGVAAPGEAQNRGRGAVDVAILFTDLVDFSTWMLEAGDRPGLRLLREVSEAIEPPITRRRGEVVKRLGDGLMGAFWDAPSAVAAGFERA